jgi:hypothetical protein
MIGDHGLSRGQEQRAYLSAPAPRIFFWKLTSNIGHQGRNPKLPPNSGFHHSSH